VVLTDFPDEWQVLSPRHIASAFSRYDGGPCTAYELVQAEAAEHNAACHLLLFDGLDSAAPGASGQETCATCSNTARRRASGPW